MERERRWRGGTTDSKPGGLMKKMVWKKKNALLWLNGGSGWGKRSENCREKLVLKTDKEAVGNTTSSLVFFFVIG